MAIAVAMALVGAASARADVAALRARREALGAIASGETDLAAAADAALVRAEADRARGDEAAAERAEHIAEATLSLIERRRARHDAEARLEEARAERDAVSARLTSARSAAESDARERARLAPQPARLPEPAP